MDKYSALLVCEVGLPTALNLCCFICLSYRCYKILNAGLLYNTVIPRRLTAKQILVGMWLMITVVQLVALNVKRSPSGRYLWIE